MNPLLPKWARLYYGTPSEWAIEPAIASLGRPYRFQHPVWALGYFPDFALIDDKVIIEVDGEEHGTEEGIIADAERTAKLEKLGWRVLRCKNEEAVNDPFGTVNRLMMEAGLPYRAIASSSQLRQPLPARPSRRRRTGRGKRAAGSRKPR